jgi:hypothetical protein
MGKGLSASQPSVRWPDRPGRGKNRAVTLKHDEGGILIGQPAQRRKWDHPVRTNDNQTPNAMPNAGKTDFPPRSNPIFKDQMAVLDAHSNPVTVESDDAMAEGEELLQDV